jgi:transposase InsO family protein
VLCPDAKQSAVETRRIIDQSLGEYNQIRPHSALEDLMPADLAALHRRQQQRVA